MTSDRSFNWPYTNADRWATSDLLLELGNRVRWPLMWENTGAERERYWHMVLVTLANIEPKTPSRSIETVQLKLELVA